MFIEINKIYNENHLDTMSRMPDDFIDLTITSPPYDDLRNYNGYSFDFEKIAHSLFRVTKNGGVVVWVVGDLTKKGSESLRSFEHALYLKNEVGFRIHDTMIYRKLNPTPNAGNRYQQCFEYMFVLSKGNPKIVNIQLRKRRNKCNDKRTYRKKKFLRNSEGEFNSGEHFIKEFVPRDNIFEYYVGGGNSSKDKIASKHPAIFPEKLVKDHIITWSNPGDLIYDPMMGSGTVAKMAIINGRNYIGSEISESYCEIAQERIKDYLSL